MKKITTILLITSTLIHAEPQAIFNGKNLNGWCKLNGEKPGDGWKVIDGGILHRSAQAGDIRTEKTYADFTLTFE